MIVLRFEPVYRLTGDAGFALSFAARFPAGLAIAAALRSDVWEGARIL